MPGIHGILFSDISGFLSPNTWTFEAGPFVEVSCDSHWPLISIRQMKLSEQANRNPLTYQHWVK